MLIHATEMEMRSIEAELLHHRQSGGILQVKVIPEDEDASESAGYEATTLLHLAAKYGNAKATQYLIENGHNVDVKNPSACTPLMVALKFEKDEIVKILLEANADIFLCNYPDVHVAIATLALRSPTIARTILGKIIGCNDSQAIAKKLLETDCPLPLSTIFRDASIMRYMLDNGRVVDEPDRTDLNRTALHYAVLLADQNIVNLLLDRGIDANVMDGGGNTPLFYYNILSEDTNEKLEVLKIMLHRGASLDVSAHGHHGTLLQCLCMHGKEDTVRILLEYNNSLLAASKDGLPLFESLVSNKKPEVIELMLSENWDFNVLNQLDALLAAAVHGNTKIFEFMLRKGVNPNAVFEESYTILFLLSMRSSNEPQRARTFLKCVEFLLWHGADVQRVAPESLTIFDVVLRNKNFAVAKVVLAHLALMKELGQPIKELFVAKINSDIRFQKYFKLCKQWLDKMKKTVICSPLTLFEFLTKSEKKITIYARNPILVSQLERIMYSQRRSNMFYCNTLRRRIKAVVKNLELRNQVAIIVSENCELRNNAYLIEKIVEFVD